MIFDHAVFDLDEFFGVKADSLGFFKEGIGFAAAWIFMTVCGVSATIGMRNIKRGAIVFSLGMVLSIGTLISDALFGTEIVICFGILHFLGLAMIISHFVKRLPVWAIALLSVLCAATGAAFERITVSFPFLFPFGLCASGFYSSDFFPLFPNLCFPFAGICVGRLLYREKKSLFRFPFKHSLICMLGRNTLLLYFLHQPVIIGILFLINLFHPF